MSLLLTAGAQAQAVFASLQSVGVSSTQTVPVAATVAGTVSTVEVLTRGASGLDFTAGSASVATPCASAVLTVGSSCQVSVTFTPAFPGLRTGAVVLLDSNKNPLGAAWLSGTGQGGLDVLAPGNILRVAGVYRSWTSTLDGIQATQANLDQPSGVTLDGAGNMYIADTLHSKIRMVCASATSSIIKGITCPGAQIIITVAGTGNPGNTGDNGPAAASTVNLPGGVSVDGAGNVYIADTANNVVRKITAATGIITTVAGDGTPGYGGDGLVATAPGVELNGPWGVTPDAAGNLLIADTANQRIRRIDAVTGIISTVAGNGNASGLGDGKGTFSGDGAAAGSAGLSLPYTVAFDSSGNMYIPDSANNRIREVTAVNGVITATSMINTVVGTGTSGFGCTNGPTSSIALNTPSGVGLDPAGNIYIADTQDSCVRKANLTSGMTIGIGVNGQPISVLSAAGAPNSAPVYAPVGIYVDDLGNVYYSDFYYMIIQKIESNEAVLNFTGTTVRQGDQSAPQTQPVENDGNASSSITAITPDANSAVDAGTTTCSPLPFALAEELDCNVGAIFAPSEAGAPLEANISVVNNTVNTPLDLLVIGDASAVNSTTVALTASPNPSAQGVSVALTATVSTGTGTGALTGSVTFTDTFNGSTTQLGGAVSVNSAGVATYSTTSLAVGVHSITATYGGDSAHSASTPATVSQTIFETTKVVLTGAPPSPSPVAGSVTFTATVSVSDGGTHPLDGSVTFTDSAATFTNNTVALSGGAATYTATAMPDGVNAITATYTPTTATLIQGSKGTLNQDVVSNATVSISSAPSSTTYGSTVTFTVGVPTVGSVAATGTVKIAIVPSGQTAPVYPLTATLAGSPAAGTATIATLPVGTYTVTATYSGDTNYGTATAALATPQVVNTVATATTAAAAPNPAIAGTAVAITAAVAPSSGSVVPTGTVTFADTFNGVTTTLGAGPIPLSATGTAVFSPLLAPGTHSILVSYSGDPNNGKSSFTLPLAVVKATTTTAVSPTPSPVTVGGTVTFSATVTGNGAIPTGTVQFLANGAITLGTGTLNAAGTTSVTYATLPAASYQITAVYSGDTNDAASTSPAMTEVVALIPTITDLTTATTTGANPQTILVSTVLNNNAAGANPTGTVTFKNGTVTVGQATLSAGGAATLTPNLGAGTYNLIAYYSGDSTHAASQSAAVTITTVGSSYTLSVTPPTISIPTTQNALLTLTLTSLSGFNDTVGLGCASLPVGVNCHFSSISVPLAANATATAQLTLDTNNPLGGGATAINTQSERHAAQVAGIFLPLSLLLGWILWRFRKRHSSVWGMVLLVALSGAALLATGCGGFTQTSATPGTYTIEVVGVGANSNVTAYQNITLTITK